jgi:hypothetical protein
MTDNEIVDSSFTATINAPIEKIELPEWCFTQAGALIQVWMPESAQPSSSRPADGLPSAPCRGKAQS